MLSRSLSKIGRNWTSKELSMGNTMTSKVSSVMQAAQEAVKSMESWSPAKRDYVERASQYNWGSDRGDRMDSLFGRTRASTTRLGDWRRPSAAFSTVELQSASYQRFFPLEPREDAVEIEPFLI